ncbi:MAG TPA: cytochrome c-type biogenesis protein [Acidimicrobiia bacterium]|nr:cytochrome c-type biogenesis protein [Acidimicrobiia bacterium]
MKRWGPWALLAVIAAVVLAVAAWPSGGHATIAERTRSLASELRCVDCEALSIADSATPTAAAQRADIEARLRAGQTDGQIRQAYVDRYGPSILLKPQNDGIGILVWGLPVAAFILGAGGLAYALWRWRREPRLAATEADEQLVAQAREAG